MRIKFNADTMYPSYEVDENGKLVYIQSIRGDIPAYLRFVNKTNRPIDIWWRDYDGNRLPYDRIGAGEYLDVDSFITHPWEFTDAVTNERYVINNKIVFRPPPSIGNMHFRTHWHITPGVRSLRRLALIALGTSMKNEDDVETLGLPEALVEEAKAAVKYMNMECPIEW